MAAIEHAGRDAQAPFAVLPVRDIVLNGDKAGCDALFVADWNAIGMHPVRFAGPGVMEDVFLNDLGLVQLLVDAFDGVRVCVRPVQHFLWQTSAHLLKLIPRVLLKTGVYPFNATGIIQHHQKIGRNCRNHCQAIGVDVCGRCNRGGGSGHESQ